MEIPIVVTGSKGLLLKITKLVDTILSTKANDMEADISPFICQLDIIFYSIYELSYAEACVVEGNTEWMSQEAYEAIELK